MDRKELFMENMNLVPYILKGMNLLHHKNYEDYMQEGYLALWRVCLNFDESRGYALSTYAIPVIKGSIRRYRYEKDYMIRISRSIYYRIANNLKLNIEDEELSDILEKVRCMSSLDYPLDDTSNSATLSDIIADPNSDKEYLDCQLLIDEILLSLDSYNSEHKEMIEEMIYDRLYGDKKSQEYYARNIRYLRLRHQEYGVSLLTI